MPKELYNLWSWQWWIWALAMLIGICSLVLTLWTVLRRDATRQALLRWFVFWALAPVLWCTMEYHHLFSSLPDSKTTSEAFEYFKYGQEVGTKFWIAMFAIMGARLMWEDRRKQGDDSPEENKGAPNKAIDSDKK